MLKWILLAAGGITIYVLTKPSYGAGCFTMINPFASASGVVSGAGFAAVNNANAAPTWSWCPWATAPGNSVASANQPIPDGTVTSTDTGGLNSNVG